MPGEGAAPTRSLRWASRSYSAGTGVLVNRPGRLYYGRLVIQATGSQTQIAVLRDDVTATAGAGAVVLVLDAGNENPDDWPRIPVSAGFNAGLKVEWLGTGAAAVMVGWEPD
jgi:subtilisin family serine protease